jgi:hypothetical protein
MSSSGSVKLRYEICLVNWGNAKVRYCGLKKKTAQLVTLFALSNVWIVRGKLMAAQGSIASASPFHLATSPALSPVGGWCQNFMPKWTPRLTCGFDP